LRWNELLAAAAANKEAENQCTLEELTVSAGWWRNLNQTKIFGHEHESYVATEGSEETRLRGVVERRGNFSSSGELACNWAGAGRVRA